jgi:hypothetical protein
MMDKREWRKEEMVGDQDKPQRLSTGQVPEGTKLDQFLISLGLFHPWMV